MLKKGGGLFNIGPQYPLGFNVIKDFQQRYRE